MAITINTLNDSSLGIDENVIQLNVTFGAADLSSDETIITGIANKRFYVLSFQHTITSAYEAIFKAGANLEFPIKQDGGGGVVGPTGFGFLFFTPEGEDVTLNCTDEGIYTIHYTDSARIAYGR